MGITFTEHMFSQVANMGRAVVQDRRMTKEDYDRLNEISMLMEEHNKKVQQRVLIVEGPGLPNEEEY
jgi:hypothetical protein